MGDLVPSIYEIGSATDTLNPSLMGTVLLRLTDDKRDKHSFTLNNVNYLPDSPVNLLSLRRLAELYPDPTGHPDKTGTGIRSDGFESYTIFWDRENTRRHCVLLHRVFQNACSIQDTQNLNYSRQRCPSTILIRSIGLLRQSR